MIQISAIRKVSLTVPQTKLTAARPIAMDPGDTIDLLPFEFVAAQDDLEELRDAGVVSFTDPNLIDGGQGGGGGGTEALVSTDIKTADYLAKITDQLILCGDPLAQIFNISLPDAGLMLGKTITVGKVLGANDSNINVNTAVQIPGRPGINQCINGVLNGTQTIWNPGYFVTFIALPDIGDGNGPGWWTLGQS